MKNIKLFIALLGAFCITCNLSAQNEQVQDSSLLKRKAYDVGFLIGMASYEGDMIRFSEENPTVFTSAGIAFGVNFNYHFSRNFDGGLSYCFGKIKGDDRDGDPGNGRFDRGYSFTNNLHELSLRLQYSPLGHKTYKLTPYIYTGVGMVFHNPDIDFNESNQTEELKIKIAQDKAEIEKKSILFPVGFGLNYNINEKYSIKLEGALRLGANDYIDGVTLAASTANNEYYGIGGLVFSYKFGNKKVSNDSDEIKPE